YNSATAGCRSRRRSGPRSCSKHHSSRDAAAASARLSFRSAQAMAESDYVLDLIGVRGRGVWGSVPDEISLPLLKAYWQRRGSLPSRYQEAFLAEPRRTEGPSQTP